MLREACCDGAAYGPLFTGSAENYTAVLPPVAFGSTCRVGCRTQLNMGCPTRVTPHRLGKRPGSWWPVPDATGGTTCTS